MDAFAGAFHHGRAREPRHCTKVASLLDSTGRRTREDLRLIPASSSSLRAAARVRRDSCACFRSLDPTAWPPELQPPSSPAVPAPPAAISKPRGTTSLSCPRRQLTRATAPATPVTATE
ncbi:hypothetical protein D1007_35722 [Hordeum vulgare]|nr:hypothetical protein D1007_35722 [Hordeum vulgare]